MRCWVNKGAKSIALLDENTPSGLKYVFDISDVHKARRIGRFPNEWKMSDEHTEYLNAIISEEIREGVADIFGQGTDLDNSEAVQTARKAKKLLDRLAEYKPLAKIEDNAINGMEEQNCNMIDNVLNNGAEKKETEQSKRRISIREKLAEKKAVMEKRVVGCYGWPPVFLMNKNFIVCKMN